MWVWKTSPFCWLDIVESFSQFGPGREDSVPLEPELGFRANLPLALVRWDRVGQACIWEVGAFHGRLVKWLCLVCTYSLNFNQFLRNYFPIRF